MISRLLRATLTATLLVVLGVGVATASQNGSPVVTGLSTYLVRPGLDLVLLGGNFSSDLPTTTGDCSTAGLPTVHFYPMAGGNPINIQPAGTDSAHCSNGQVHVGVPAAITGAARVSISDPQGHESNGNLVVTMVPNVSVSPSTGPIGTHATIVGSGLHPGSTVAGSNVSVSMDNAGRTALSWTDTGIGFDPADSSGEVRAAYTVFHDLNAAGDPSKQEVVGLDAGHYEFQAPSMDGGTIDHQVVGSRLSLSGHNLGSGGYVQFPGGARGQSVAWSSSQVGVTVPPGAQSGGLTVVVNGWGSPLAGPTVNLDPKTTGLSPSRTSGGQQVRITGYNLGSSRGTVTVGGANQGINNWTDQGVAFTVNPDTDGGAVAVTRADGVVVSVGSLTIVPRLDRLESNNVPAGSQVVVDGASLGAASGSVSLGSTPGATLLWSRTSVLVQVPTGIAPGTYPVVVTSAAGAASNALNLVIVPGPAKPAPTNSTAPLGIGGAVAPSFDNNHQFVKPIKPPSPVFFNVATDPHKIKAGETATVTVTLKLNDKPQPGAEVHLSMLFTPGNDYKFTPESGVTDADGVFKATVKVSKNAGDSVVAATSGVFSDQDHVTGTAADGKTVSATPPAPAQNGGFAPLIVLGIAAVALVAAGFYLNVRSMGS